MPQLTTRPARESDSLAIARIQQASPEAAQWPVGDYSNYNVTVALDGNRVVGFCAYRQTAPGETELLNLAVDPAFRRMGVASALLRSLAEGPPGDIFLEVAENNEAALTLYDRLGWERVSIRPGYYSQGNINAVVMKKSSC